MYRTQVKGGIPSDDLPNETSSAKSALMVFLSKCIFFLFRNLRYFQIIL